MGKGIQFTWVVFISYLNFEKTSNLLNLKYDNGDQCKNYTLYSANVLIM